jgi:hypothetical protein
VESAEEEADDDATDGGVEDANLQALTRQKADSEGEQEPDEPPYESEELHFG